MDVPGMDVPGVDADVPGMDAPGDVTCPASQTNCAGLCVDLTSDANNCGACGNACPAGQRCSASACVPSCGAGETLCAGRCVNTQTDTNNCGACGTMCPAGQVCSMGTCGTACAPPLMLCTSGGTSTCADVQTDASNCGSCGHACAAGQACVGGSCGCPAGQTACSGRCVDTSVDRANCGACAHACSGTEVCVAGMCRAGCPTGQMNCGGVCVDTTSDSSNCGACGNACTGGRVCAASACACPAGQTTCAGACTDTRTDNANCGACGTACTGGQTCVAGACVCAAGQTLCAGRCADTQTDNANCGACGTTCPAGTTCMAGACRCPAGQTLCGGACVDTQTDVTNCGACGHACGAGQSCVSGACACPAGQTLCAGVCVTTATDEANCGSCGHACATGATCTAGVCSCPAGQSVCSNRCVDLQSDPTNCGSCGHACAAGQVCSVGACGTVPSNDTRAGATNLSLVVPALTITTSTTNATNNTTGSCGCTAGHDVFYRFTLTQTELVYADSVGSTFDTSLFFQTSGGANIADPGITGGATCSDDGGVGCTAGTQSMIAARLTAGTYYLVLSGCGQGLATMHFQHLPVGNGALTRFVPTTGVTQTFAGTTSGTGLISATCCSGGPENTYWFVTCPSFAAAPFYATTCGAAAFDTSLNLRNANGAPTNVCNDDSCGLQSNLASTVPAGAGLHTLYVDSCAGSGAYSVSLTAGACAAGTALCTGRCVDLQTNNSNCGACGVVCNAGYSCQTGACRPVNDQCANATAVTLGAGTLTLSGSTVTATNSTLSCDSVGRDVFFRFTLTQRELVYLDTFGSSFDTEVGFVPGACGTATLACNDDSSCGGLQSQTTAVLDAGTHYIVLDSHSTTSGAYTLHIQHIPTANAPAGLLNFGTSVVLGTTAGSTNTTATCGSGPDRVWYWTTCPAYSGHLLTASTCGRASWDTILQVRNGWGIYTACFDDQCGTQSSLSYAVPSGAGLHALVIDGYGATSSGTYSIAVSNPP